MAKLSRALTAVLADKEFIERYTALGIEPLGGAPEQFAAYIRTELARWGKVTRESSARID